MYMHIVVHITPTHSHYCDLYWKFRNIGICKLHMKISNELNIHYYYYFLKMTKQNYSNVF